MPLATFRAQTRHPNCPARAYTPLPILRRRRRLKSPRSHSNRYRGVIQYHSLGLGLSTACRLHICSIVRNTPQFWERYPVFLSGRPTTYVIDAKASRVLPSRRVLTRQQLSLPEIRAWASVLRRRMGKYSTYGFALRPVAVSEPSGIGRQTAAYVLQETRLHELMGRCGKLETST